MGILVACVIVLFVLFSLGGLALWVNSRRQERRLARIEAQRNLDIRCIETQFWKHEVAIQQNAATSAAAEREIVQLATRFVRVKDTLKP